MKRMKKAGLGLLILVLLLGSLPVRAAKASAEEGEHKISLTVESYDEEGKKIKDETDCIASVSTEEAKEGEEITITQKPGEDFQLFSASWKAGKENERLLSDSLAFKMPDEDVAVTVRFQKGLICSCTPKLDKGDASVIKSYAVSSLWADKYTGAITWNTPVNKAFTFQLILEEGYEPEKDALITEVPKNNKGKAPKETTDDTDKDKEKEKKESSEEPKEIELNWKKSDEKTEEGILWETKADMPENSIVLAFSVKESSDEDDQKNQHRNPRKSPNRSLPLHLSRPKNRRRNPLQNQP